MPKSKSLPIRIIKTRKELEVALARMLHLMRKAPALTALEADELELLGLVIEDYERKNFPTLPADPIEAIKFMMDQQGRKKKDLIPYIGSAQKVAEVLSGSRSLSLSMIRRLSERMGIPADILIRPTIKKRA